MADAPWPSVQYGSPPPSDLDDTISDEEDAASVATLDSKASRKGREEAEAAPEAAPAKFAADFACGLEDGARVTAVQTLAHGKPIVVLKCTEPSGLTVDVGTDGVVRMRHVGVARAGAPPPLHDIVDALKRNLGLDGTWPEVVDAACLQLGVPPTGSLQEKGDACWRAMEG